MSRFNASLLELRLMSKTVLVTGGAGFIGSHLCEGLLAEGCTVRVLDDLSVGLRKNVPEGCEFSHGAIQDASVLQEAMSGVDAVFHLAARVTIRGSVENFVEDAETNLLGTLHVLREAARQKVQRVIYASSMAVYADSDSPTPVSERYRTDPASPYGIAKLAAERYVMLMAKDLSLETVVLRYFNTFGTRQTFTPYVGVITIFVTQLLRHEGITIYGDGHQVRDFVHVSDIVRANLLAWKHPDAAGRTFNVGSGKGTSVLEVSRLLREKLFPNAAVEFAPARTEELRNSIADISRIQKTLGYSPQTDLEHQIDEVIEYLR